MNPIRRMLLNAIACTPFILWLPGANAQKKLLPTPSQPEGPFYPREFPEETDADLMHYGGASAKGALLELKGRVSGTDGSPVANAVVEIWQCDADGHYRYDAASMRAADHGFQGFGKTVTDNSGHYRFITMRPVPYPGRPPHVHMRIMRDGKHLLTTQMYVKGDGAEKDPFIARLPDAARRLLLANLVRTPSGFSTQFDIVVATV